MPDYKNMGNLVKTQNVDPHHDGTFGTVGSGYNADLSGNAGDGDYVSQDYLIDILYADTIDLGKIFYRDSLFMNLIRRSHAKWDLSPNLAGVASGNKVIIPWEAPIFASKLAEACEIPVSDFGVGAVELGNIQYLGGAIGTRCECTPVRRCTNTRDHRFSKERFRAKLIESMKSSLLLFDQAFFEIFKARAKQEVSKDTYTRQQQASQMILDAMKDLSGDPTKPFDLNNPKFQITDFDYIMLASPQATLELQLTPNAMWENRIMERGYQSVIGWGYKGTIQDFVPVIQVDFGIIPEADGGLWLVNLDFIYFALGCENFYETPEAVYDDAKKVVKVGQTKYAYRLAYSIVDWKDKLPFTKNVKWYKGKKDLLAPVGVTNITAPATVGHAGAPVTGSTK